MPDPPIRVEGLAELRKSLRALDRGAARDMQKGLRAAMRPVARHAAALAGPMFKGGSGRLAASLKPFAAGNTAGVRSRVPYANVQHWGGTTGKGHRPGVAGSGSVRVRPHPFVVKAVDQDEQKIIDAIGDAIDRHARRTGWK